MAASIGLLGAASIAQAQSFTFSTSFNPNPITTSQAGSQINVFNTSSNGNAVYAGGSGTDIVLANFTTTSDADASSPAFVNSPFNTVTLSLQPTNSSAIGTAGAGTPFSFTGSLTGQISSTSVFLRNSFVGQTQTINYGNGQIFTVMINSFTTPGPSSQTVRGSLTAHVIGSSQTINAAPMTPEPGTLALLVGLSISGSAAILRRRRTVKK